MPSTLECLSNELLDRIISYVESTHKPTLKALTLVNHHVHAVACPYLFTPLRLHVKHQEEVLSVVESLPARVSQHTRHLTIEGLPRASAHSGFGSDSPEFQDPFYHPARQNWNVLHRANRSPIPSRHSFMDAEAVGPVDDTKWKPLAVLIAQMSNLRDLTYNSGYQLAPCVLEAIHRSRPRIRLHFNTFHLRSLRKSNKFDPFSDLDKNSLAIATSPCLYSIAAAFEERPNDEVDILRELATGLAPNLQEIHTFPAPKDYFMSCCLSEVRLPSWQALRLDGHNSSQSTQVKPPHSSTRLRLELGDLENWCDIVAFSKLQSFELYVFSLDQLNYLANCSFDSLETLVLDIGDSHPIYSRLVDRFDMPTSNLLASIPPLKTLSITGAAGPITFSTILEYHGPSLQKLCFVPRQQENQFVLNIQQLRELKESRPILEELTIKAPRSQGDQREVEIYKTLGSIARLQTLRLFLDASTYGAASPEYWNSDWRPEDPDFERQVPDDPSFDANEREIMIISTPAKIGLRKGFARKAFINAAMDEALARSIFMAISAGKPRSGAQALEKLGISVTGQFDVCRGGSFGLDGFRDLARYISHSWIVERSPRDDCRDRLILTDVVPNGIMFHFMSSQNQDAESCYRDLWPGDSISIKSGGKNWLDCWHSFPLQGFEDPSQSHAGERNGTETVGEEKLTQEIRTQPCCEAPDATQIAESLNV